MHKTKTNQFFLSGLLLLLLIAGCKGAYSLAQQKNSDYVPGQITIGFADTVSLASAKKFIAQQGLEPINLQFNTMISMWAEIDSGTAADHITRLKADSTVLWAEKRGYNETDKKPNKEYLLIQFNLRASEKSANRLIGALDGITIKKLNAKPKWGVIAVREGQEQFWIEKLRAFPFVRYVERNAVAKIDRAKK